MLASLALGGSLLLCLPCGCFNGILAGIGATAVAFPDFETGISATENLYFTGLFGAISVAALLAGGLLFYWGLRTLRQETEMR